MRIVFVIAAYLLGANVSGIAKDPANRIVFGRDRDNSLIAGRADKKSLSE